MDLVALGPLRFSVESVDLEHISTKTGNDMVQGAVTRPRSLGTAVQFSFSEMLIFCSSRPTPSVCTSFDTGTTVKASSIIQNQIFDHSFGRLATGMQSRAVCESSHQVCTWGTFELLAGCAQAVRCAKAKAQKPEQVAVFAYELISQAVSPEHS